MYCVGLTGGIASGKSSVAACFLALNIDIISADAIAKELTMPGQPALDSIVNHFGPSVINEAHELNRKQLRHLIFQHKEERQWLEALLHPLIRQTIEHRAKQCQSPYCIIEIPLLLSKADYPYLNRILLVQSTPEQQLKRVMARDHSSMNEAQSILEAQPDDALRQQFADDCLMNDGTFEALKEKVLLLHQRYLNNANAMAC